MIPKVAIGHFTMSEYQNYGFMYCLNENVIEGRQTEKAAAF